MRKIIFDNIAAGFPADEQFMRVVDEHREAITQLCFALFGNQATILRGLEITHIGGANPTTRLNSGYIWAFNTLLYVKEQEFKGNVSEDRILIGRREKLIEATYYNGKQLPAYNTNNAYVVVNDNPGHAGGLFISYQDATRIDGLFKKWKVTYNGEGVNTSISVTHIHGNINLRGTAEMNFPSSIDRWVSLGNLFQTQNISLPDGMRDLAVMCVVERPPFLSETENNFTDYIGTVKINRQGDLSIRLSRTFASQSSIIGSVTAHINLTFNIF